MLLRQAEVKLNAKNLEEQAKLLDVLRSTLDVKEKQLEATTGNNKQLHAALEEHATTRLDLQQQLDAKISELDSVKKDLAVAKSYATVKIQDLSKSSKELEESRLALQTKTQELGKTAKELEESKLTLQKTIKELDESRLALQSKTQELGKTNKELEESRVGLQAKAKELDELRRATEKTLELKTQEILLLEKALTKTKTLEVY